MKRRFKRLLSIGMSITMMMTSMSNLVMPAFAEDSSDEPVEQSVTEENSVVEKDAKTEETVDSENDSQEKSQETDETKKGRGFRQVF